MAAAISLGAIVIIGSSALPARATTTKPVAPASTAGSSSPASARAPRSTSPSSTCQDDLTAFAAAASGGSLTNDQNIVFATADQLNNPSVAGTSTSSQDVVISFVVYDASGNVVTPSPSEPVTVAIYDAPPGSVTTTPTEVAPGKNPLKVLLTSGTSFTLHYRGSYLSRPLTVIALDNLGTTNSCTNSPDEAIGSTTIALANRAKTAGTASYSSPTKCKAGTSGQACAAANVDSDGLSVSAAIGYGSKVPTSPAPVTPATSAELASATIDTGSIGTVVPFDKLGPNAVGPGPMAMKYYDSSGNEFIGVEYIAPVTLTMGASRAQTIPIRVLAVLTSACHTGKSCTGPPPFANFYYLGIGFDRSAGQVGSTFASPRDNAFLSVEPPAGKVLSQGYILSGGSVTTGITASDSAGFRSERLTASTSTPGDYLGAPICVTFPSTSDPAPTPVCGDMLLDVGIPQMYLTFSTKADEPAAVSSGLKANQVISLASPSASSAVLAYSFSSGATKGGAAPPAIGMAPKSVGLSAAPAPPASGGAVFINTGRHILFQNAYLFNAALGRLGFLPLSSPLR